MSDIQPHTCQSGTSFASEAERKQKQEAFLHHIDGAQQLRLLFEYLPGVYFFVKDAKSRLMAASGAILKRFGLESEHDIVGTTDYDYFPPHVADDFVRDDQRVLATGEPLINHLEIWYNEHRVLDWFVTNKLPLRNRAGRIVGIMGTIRSYESSRDLLLPYAQVADVVDYIRKNHRGKLSVAQVAERAGVSPRQLHRRFIDVFGMNVIDFLKKTRIQAASDELLHTDRRIADIAIDFGFCDQSAFTRQFRAHIGQTPLQFRRRYVS